MAVEYEALRLAKSIPRYFSKFSNKIYCNHQKLAIYVLMQKLKLTYRVLSHGLIQMNLHGCTLDCIRCLFIQQWQDLERELQKLFIWRLTLTKQTLLQLMQQALNWSQKAIIIEMSGIAIKSRKQGNICN